MNFLLCDLWHVIFDIWFLSSWNFFPFLWDLLVHKSLSMARERWIWRGKVWKLEKSGSIVVNLTELQVTQLKKLAGRKMSQFIPVFWDLVWKMINCKSNESSSSLLKKKSMMKRLYLCKLLSYFQVVSTKLTSLRRPCQGYKRHERGNLVSLAEPVLYIAIRSFMSGERALWFCFLSYSSLCWKVPSFCNDVDDIDCRLEDQTQKHCLEYNYDYENGFAIGNYWFHFILILNHLGLKEHDSCHNVFSEIFFFK